MGGPSLGLRCRPPRARKIPYPQCTCTPLTHAHTGNLDNLVVASDPADLLDKLAAWEPVEKGLLLSAELRTAAVGSDVNTHKA